MLKIRLRTIRSAFTLFEMLITITILALVIVMAAPSFTDDSRLRLMAASSIMTSDIELAQVMTIAAPEDPVIVQFVPDTSTYWLAYADTPTTPLTRVDTGEDYLVTLGVGRASSAEGVTFTISDFPDDDQLEFNAQGGLTDFTLTPQITLNHDDESIILTVAPTTGTVTESEGDAGGGEAGALEGSGL